MSKKSPEWNRLDNAAKIFPSNTGKRDTKVFRFSCELYEEVVPEFLQQALDITVAYFPIFRSVMKKGLFWYYFEQSRLEPVVLPETRPVCSPLYNPDYRTLLFEVTYFGRRINFEVFHALTDGTGAMQFLKMLVSQYLKLKYPDKDLPSLDYDASTSQKSEDSFQKYYDPKTTADKAKRVSAYQIKGSKEPEGRLNVIEGVLPVKALLALAHQYHTTLTVFVAAVLIRSIGRQMATGDKRKPVVLDIPVNLRNYFDSETARNFFGVINVSYHFGERSGELDDIIEQVAKTMHEELTREKLSGIINDFIKIERNAAVRIGPLPLKDIVLRQAGRINQREATSSLSNIGRTDIPPELKPYIRLFDVICSTDRTQLCLCSCGDLLTACFSSVFESTEVQKNFFRTFTELGISAEISSNDSFGAVDAPAINRVNPLQFGNPNRDVAADRAEHRLKKETKRQQKQTEKAGKNLQKKIAAEEKRKRKAESKTIKHLEKTNRKQALQHEKQEKKALKKLGRAKRNDD